MSPESVISETNEIKIFSGSANKRLSKRITDHLMIPLSKITLKRFPDSEIYVKIEENVRGVDTFVVQPLCRPVNENFVELAIVIDALKRASAERVTAVIPYFGYARQDRKTSGREPITAKLIANMLVAAGLDRVLTLDLHSDQIQGFFDIPVDHLTAIPLITNYIKKKNYLNAVVVSPDLGSVKRARKIANMINVPLAILDKVREEPNVVSRMSLLGDVQDKSAIVIDDMIDTGGTIFKAIEAIFKRGAKNIYVYVIHPVFSEPAPENILNLNVSQLVTTDTIFIDKNYDNVKVLSIAPLLADAIKNIHQKKSVSTLFDKHY